MPRPSRNTDRLLLDAGRRLLPETGVSGLSLRKVAALAKVNLGMFHYHFGSKRKFVRRLLQDIYEEFFRDFSLETAREAPCDRRLAAALVALARFARDNRRLILALLRDAVNEEPEVLGFAKANVPRHVGILAGLVRECQKAGMLQVMPLPTALPFLAVSAAVPSLGLALMERASARSPLGLPLAVLRPMIISDKAIDLRVEAAIKGLRRTP